MYADTILQGNIGFEKDELDLDRLLIRSLPLLGDVISPGISEYEPLANKEILIEKLKHQTIISKAFLTVRKYNAT